VPTRGRPQISGSVALIHLAEARLVRPPDAAGFPFDVPVVRALERIRFETPVTLFVALLALMREMVDADCQLVIATHSPILLAMPGAAILTFDEATVRRVAWEDLEHVRLTRDFLANPQAFLRHL
jgi:predicted ATPase